MTNIDSRIRMARSLIDQKLGEIKSLERQKSTLIGDITKLRSDIELYGKVSILLNSLAENRQERIQQQVEELVTQGLQSVFGDSISFHLINSVKANKQVLDLIIRSKLPNGRTFDTDMNARGGGMAALVGFLLRLVVLLLTKKDKPKLLVLDETFSHLSEEYRPAVAEFIRQIVDRTDTQVIMVTHFHDLSATADKIYQFSLSKTGETIIKETEYEK